MPCLGYCRAGALGRKEEERKNKEEEGKRRKGEEKREGREKEEKGKEREEEEKKKEERGRKKQAIAISQQVGPQLPLGSMPSAQGGSTS